MTTRSINPLSGIGELVKAALSVRMDQMAQKDKADHLGMDYQQRLKVAMGAPGPYSQEARDSYYQGIGDALPDAMGGGIAAGTLKNPWSKLLSVTSGYNPLEGSKKEWGKVLQNLGPSIRTKNSETIGAQLLDEFPKNTNFRDIIHGRLSKEGLPENLYPKMGSDPHMDPGIAGFYNPKNNSIMINSGDDVLGDLVQHQQENILGTVGHEAQHAIDFQKYGFLGRPETLVSRSRPLTNNRLESAGILTPEKVAVILDAAKNKDLRLFSKLSDRTRFFLDRASSPRALADAMKYDPQLRAEMGDIYRQSVGNRGFRGNDPYLADQIHTSGHFRSPISGEMDIAPHYMAKEEARLGSGDIHEDWLSDPVRKARDSYESPMVQVAAPIPARVEAKAAMNPYAAVGMGGGLAAGAYAAKKQFGPQIGKTEAQGEDDEVLNPRPRPQSIDPSESEFESTVKQLRALIKNNHWSDLK